MLFFFLQPLGSIRGAKHLAREQSAFVQEFERKALRMERERAECGHSGSGRGGDIKSFVWQKEGGTWPSLSPHTLEPEGLGSVNLWPFAFFFYGRLCKQGGI